VRYDQLFSPRLRVPLTIASMILFLAALTASPSGTYRHWPSWEGAFTLALGWIGVFTGQPANLAWLANPALVYGWILLFARKKWAFAPVLTAVGLAALYLAPLKVSFGDAAVTRPPPEAGYWLWLGSTLVAACAALPSLGGNQLRETTSAWHL
jgi:hypothetical protein